MNMKKISDIHYNRFGDVETGAAPKKTSRDKWDGETTGYTCSKQCDADCL